ncbi:hypothetical protein ACIRSU_35910 [Streptomyces sp. NPDC101160]|uniref:hypothetical protein n=1 Tax=Streptomyces sp. NPDC101160 TaxID=3366118 RepID=UPI00382C286F
MNGRRRRALLTAVTPMLEPGELVEVTTVVNLSTVSAGRTAAFGMASAIASGGSVTVIPVPTPMYLVLTDRRIVIFEADPVFAKPVRHTMTIQRAGLFRSAVKERFVNSSFVLSSPYSASSLKLIFPLVERKARNQVVAALPVTAD